MLYKELFFYSLFYVNIQCSSGNKLSRKTTESTRKTPATEDCFGRFDCTSLLKEGLHQITSLEILRIHFHPKETKSLRKAQLEAKTRSLEFETIILQGISLWTQQQFVNLSYLNLIFQWAVHSAIGVTGTNFLVNRCNVYDFPDSDYFWNECHGAFTI